MALSGEQFTIRAGEHVATVVSIGAGLREYQVGDREVVPRYGDGLPPKCSGASLLPWPNRIRDGRYSFEGVEQQLALTEPKLSNASHGLARYEEWAVAELGEQLVSLELRIPPQNGWTYELTTRVTYELDEQSGLTVRASATNHGTTRAPFGAGFHPYLAIGAARLADVALQIPAATRLTTDERLIPIGTEAVERTDYDFRAPRPIGTTRLDDAYGDLTGREATVRLPDGHGATLWFDGSFGYLQVFTPEVLVDGRAAVAIEPMTCPANAFNSGEGLLVLEPGEGWAGTWGIAPF